MKAVATLLSLGCAWAFVPPQLNIVSRQAAIGRRSVTKMDAGETPKLAKIEALKVSYFVSFLPSRRYYLETIDSRRRVEDAAFVSMVGGG